MGGALSALDRRLPGDGWVVWAIVGVPLLLLGIGAIVISTAFDKPQEAQPVGPNLPVNEGAADPADISSNNSPALVRNPRDPGNLVVANRIDTPRYSCALHVSADGGSHWSQTAIPAPAGERACYAPDVAFADDGTLYLAFVTLSGRANTPSAAWITTSKNGGRTLSPPRRVLGKLAFQVRLAADPRRSGRVFLTWLKASEVGLYKFTEPGNPIRVLRSDDGGRTWQSGGRVNAPSRRRVVAPTPGVGPKGELYVLYLDLGEDELDYGGAHRGRGGPPYPGRWKLVLARSDDGGEKWKETVAEQRLVPSQRFVVFTPPFPALAVDRVDGRVYASFHDQRLGSADVWLWSLRPGGRAWIGPTRVNDTPRGDRTSQYLPQLAVAPDGRLDVLYLDRRSDAENVKTEVSLQSSSDGGAGFRKRIPISSRPFDSRIGPGSERRLADPGSRIALLSTDSRAFAVWADTRAGTRETDKQDLARALVGFSDPARLSDFTKYLLRIGGIVLAMAGLALLGVGAMRAAGRSPQHVG